MLVVEQGCDRPFNSGALKNIGVQLAGGEDSDSVCLHDVDMLPDSELIPEYTKALSPAVVRHLASAYARYTRPSFLGGAVMLQMAVFWNVNGYPNDLWGWGGEDDELRDRLTIDGVRLAVQKCAGGITDLEGRTFTQKMTYLKKREQKCANKRDLRRWHRTHPSEQGLAQVQWQVMDTLEYYPNCTQYTVNIVEPC